MNDKDYNKEACELKHDNIENTLVEHKKLLDEHTQKIDVLEKDSTEYKTEIRNLIKKMDDFMSTVKWGLGIFVTVSIFVIGILIKK